MNLTIKDLSASTELDRAAMTALRGGANGNADVMGAFQRQDVVTPVFALAGPGAAQNVFVDVDASQSSDQDSDQNIGDKLKVLLGAIDR